MLINANCANSERSASGEPVGYKTCTQCRYMLPLSYFRFKSRELGTRHAACRDCRNRKHVEKKLALKRRRLSKCITQLRRTHSMREMDAVIAVVVREFGGIEQLGKFWAQSMMDAGKCKPGDPRWAIAFVKIMCNSEVLRPRAESTLHGDDYDLVTDEDIEREFRNHIRAVLDEDEVDDQN